MKKYQIFIVFFCLLSTIIFTGCGGHKHSMGNWETKTPATCTQAEVKHRLCDCGYEETQDGSPKLNHNYKIEETVAPTQMQNGYIKYVCNCGESYKQYRCLLTFSSVIYGQNIDASDMPVIEHKIVDKDSVFLGVEDYEKYVVSEYRIYYGNDIYSTINVGDKITQSTTITIVWENAEEKTEEQKQFEQLLKKINKLEEISVKYNNEFSSENNAFKRVFQYIRATRYNTTQWNLLGGTIEQDFMQYVQDNQGEFNLQSLQNLDYFIIPSTKEKVDFVHMMAIINVVVANGIDANSPNDLVGWGGDFCQLVAQIKPLNLTGEQLKQKANELLGNDVSTFGAQDICADFDAINISSIFIQMQTKSISVAMKQYYNNFVKSTRNSDFLKNAFAETYTSENTLAAAFTERLTNNLYISMWCKQNNVSMTEDIEIFNAVAISLAKYLFD